ncbi:D-proline reductase (dithiol) protein PrdB [Caldicellulosiruptor changbaiensis]|uniref:D-proline reductase (Dithiol) protein PrdB n=1 Tax=Caldicellulosiruptor changbaiensis TaxID=1222016 RepID=A0A3T0D8K8_9FIRM|nr:D-proline reductase (dithiol) protein PrdB [Caldicellulosiruptor changbaiensis]AZT91316.1 D-proline reductase (dithiol) protein PrdB [Caldicellulosiruptor changbaiensis]
MVTNWVIEGIRSEVYVPVVPEPVFTPLTKDLKDCVVALVTAAGVHLKSQKPFNLAGDFSYREIPGDTPSSELMVTHGGYDNTDVNKDINCMFPIDRLRELAQEGFIRGVAKIHIGFMGGGGNTQKFTEETGPAIARLLKETGVDAAVLTAGCGTCHRSAVIVQRAIEREGIPTVIIAALPPVAKHQGAPRIVAPKVPIGANAGEPNNVNMQKAILKDALLALKSINRFGEVIELPYEYRARI